MDNFDLHIFQFMIDFVIFDSFLRFQFLQQPKYCFVYQWLDNVKLNKYGKVGPNIPFCSRIMSIDTH